MGGEYNAANDSECYAEEIFCGDQIGHNTGGGTNFYDSDTYISWYEAIYTKSTDFSGAERSYIFSIREMERPFSLCSSHHAKMLICCILERTTWEIVTGSLWSMSR